MVELAVIVEVLEAVDVQAPLLVRSWSVTVVRAPVVGLVPVKVGATETVSETIVPVVA